MIRQQRDDRPVGRDDVGQQMLCHEEHGLLQ